MSKTLIAKRIVSFIVGAGAAKIISGIVTHNTDPENIYDSVTIVAGSMVMGAVLAEHCKQYTDKSIDEIIAIWQGEKNIFHIHHA
jgi:hypothetical protein